MKKIIAIVEDEDDQRQHYADALRDEDYEVIEYTDRESAISGFKKSMPDLAILDIKYGIDVGGGFEVCRFLKDKSPELPVIFLTSRGNELDQIYGLQLGAWDYQSKPVSLDYLITRVRSLFQIMNATSKNSTNTHTVGGITLDDNNMTVQWKNTPVNLTPTEFEILREIVRNPNGVSTDDLVKVTRQGVIENNTINTHILHIRKKIKQVDTNFACIKARYGFGYRWNCGH